VGGGARCAVRGARWESTWVYLWPTQQTVRDLRYASVGYVLHSEVVAHLRCNPLEEEGEPVS